eukprot:4732492-Alexandrium_andersonii.AAC.1
MAMSNPMASARADDGLPATLATFIHDEVASFWVEHRDIGPFPIQPSSKARQSSVEPVGWRNRPI